MDVEILLLRVAESLLPILPIFFFSAPMELAQAETSETLEPKRNYGLPQSGDRTGTAVQPGGKGEDLTVSSFHAQSED